MFPALLLTFPHLTLSDNNYNQTERAENQRLLRKFLSDPIFILLAVIFIIIFIGIYFVCKDQTYRNPTSNKVSIRSGRRQRRLIKI